MCKCVDAVWKYWVFRWLNSIWESNYCNGNDMKIIEYSVLHLDNNYLDRPSHNSEDSVFLDSKETELKRLEHIMLRMYYKMYEPISANMTRDHYRT